MLSSQPRPQNSKQSSANFVYYVRLAYDSALVESFRRCICQLVIISANRTGQGVTSGSGPYVEASPGGGCGVSGSM